jgi:dipeptidyl aminopeptidase/acylaminoacyl peptidase
VKAPQVDEAARQSLPLVNPMNKKAWRSRGICPFMNPSTVLSLTLAILVGCGGKTVSLSPAAPATGGSQPLVATPASHVSRKATKAPVALEEYFKTLRVRGLTFSSDEKTVVTMSDRGGRADLWAQPIAGGTPTQITHAEGFIHSFAFSPTADVLAYEADKGGDELPHLYLTNSRGEAAREIVPDMPAGARTQFIDWARDGKTLLFLSSARDPKQQDLWEYDLKAGRATMLWKSEGAFALNGVSDDHKRFLVVETRSDSNNDLYLIERGKPTERRLLTEHTGDVLFDANFTHDGRGLLLTSDEKGEDRALYPLDLATGKRHLEHEEPWDVVWSLDSKSGHYRFTQSNADGAPQLTIVDVKTGKPLTIPAAPRGLAWDAFDYTRSGSMFLGFSKSERYVGLVARGDTAPAVPYVIDLEAQTATPVSDVLPPTLHDHAMITATSIRIPSADGRPIPALLYTPPGNGPFPAVIDVHGGPTSQSGRDFSTIRQYLLSKGYVVLVPNVRGSTGYGKTWTRLNNHDIGGGPLRDVVACKKYLVANAQVAADEVAVMGGSYGGYMALAAETFAPEEFAANVDFFGVSDLKSLVESFPLYWASGAADIYVKFGDPKNPADAAYQHDQSPIHFIDQAKRPLLVVQGDKDARVKKDQSDHMVQGLRARGIPVRYLVLENEGHGFTRQDSYIKAYALTDRFLDRYVVGDETITFEP